MFDLPCVYTVVRDISCKIPSKRLLNTKNVPVPPISSATVTGVPSNKVSERVVPFIVNVTGNVVVVPVGIASFMRTVKYPTG